MMKRYRTATAAVAMFLAGLANSFAADILKWDAARDRVDASIETWTVPQLLQRVAPATGWEIYLDPEITNRIPTKFTGKAQGEALRRLLGDYSYALVPETNSASKFFVFRNSRDQATRAIQPLAASSKVSTNRIGNELIVTLKPGEKIEDLAKKLGAKIVGRSDGQNTYRLRFDDEKSANTARSSLQGDASVESVDSNYSVSRPETTQPLGLPGGPLPLIPKASPDGKYVVVGLVDSAIQPKEGGLAQFLLPGITVDGAAATDGPSHGTGMAQAIMWALAGAGGDKSTTVRLLPVNVFGAGGESTTTYDIAVGVYKAVNGGAMIVNMSLGGDGDSSFLHQTIKSAHDQGVVFLGAAGNQPTSTPVFPAAYEETIAVAAGNRDGSLTSYSGRGDWVDLIAPGSGMISFDGQQFWETGTSHSTAVATGVTAATAEQTKEFGAQLEARIRGARRLK
jgi:hypothetical protein